MKNHNKSTLFNLCEKAASFAAYALTLILTCDASAAAALQMI